MPGDRAGGGVGLLAALDILRGLPRRQSYQRFELLRDELVLGQEGDLRTYYAPFDYRSPHARLVLVGVTPGWTQMERAIATYLATWDETNSHRMSVEAVKQSAAFAGPLRKNLTDMLDGVGLPAALGIDSTDRLFTDASRMVHPTSAIRYPTFLGEANYSGHRPRLLRSRMLTGHVDRYLAEEIEALPKALVVPLGSAAGSAVQRLVDRGVTSSDRVLTGFPHPSGANPHRVKTFEANRAQMHAAVIRWSAVD